MPRKPNLKKGKRRSQAPKPLPQRPTRDAASLDKLLAREISLPPLPAALPAQPSKMSIAVCETADEESVAVKLAAHTLKALLEDPPFSGVLNAMIGLRRAFVLATHQMQDRAAVIRDEAKRRNLPFSDLVEEYATQFASYSAALPFEADDLLLALQDVILPWLVTVAAKQQRADQASKQEADAAAVQRATRPISVGVPHTLAAPFGELPRRSSLTFVGYRPAVLWLIDHMTDYAIFKSGNDDVAIKLVETEFNDREEQHTRCVLVGLPAWRNACNVPKQLAACLAAAAPKLSGPPDLFVCHDLSKAYDIGFKGRPAAARAGDAHKRLLALASGANAALLGGVLLPEDAQVDLLSSEYDQLRTFSVLRALRIERVTDVTGGVAGDSHYRIDIVGQAAAIKAPVHEVDGYIPKIMVE